MAAGTGLYSGAGAGADGLAVAVFRASVVSTLSCGAASAVPAALAATQLELELRVARWGGSRGAGSGQPTSAFAPGGAGGVGREEPGGHRHAPHPGTRVLLRPDHRVVG